MPSALTSRHLVFEARHRDRAHQAQTSSTKWPSRAHGAMVRTDRKQTPWTGLLWDHRLYICARDSASQAFAACESLLPFRQAIVTEQNGSSTDSGTTATSSQFSRAGISFGTTATPSPWDTSSAINSTCALCAVIFGVKPFFLHASTNDWPILEPSP